MDNGKIQYIIELLKQGDTKSAVQSLRDVQDQSKKTDEGLKQLTDTAKNALTTIGSVVAIRAAIDAFADYERVAARLNGTLKATGQFTAEYVKELAAQREALSKTTDASEGAVSGVQTLLISFGATRKEIPALTKAVLDLAAALGVDANTAALELGKALEGVDGPLSRVGITFDQNAGRADKVASAIVQLKAKYDDLAREVHDTPAGQLNALQKSVEALTVDFGRLALVGISPAVTELNKLALATHEYINSGQFGASLSRETISAASSIAALSVAISAMGSVWKLSGGGVITQAGGIAAALKAIPKSIIIAFAVTGAEKIYEAYQDIKALNAANSGADKSRNALGNQNDERRAALEKLIDEARDKDRIGRKQADDMRSELMLAFQPKTVHTDDFALGAGGMNVGSTSTYRDTLGEAATISRQFGILTGYKPGKPAAPKAQDGTTGPSALFLQEQKEGLQQIEQLQAKMNSEALEGFEKQREEAFNLYSDQAQQITNIVSKKELTGAALDQANKAQQQNTEAYATKLAAIDAAEAQAKKEHLLEQQELQARILEEGLTGIQRQVQAEKDRFQITQQRIEANKNLTPPERSGLQSLNQEQYTGAMNEITRPGLEEDRQLIAAKESAWAQHQEVVKQAFEKQKEDILALYAWKLEQAQGDADAEADVEQKLQDRLKKLRDEEKTALSQTQQDLIKVGDFAENQFASGLSDAFISIIQGTKSAGEAFQEFAASFLTSVAQMMMQLAILRGVQSVFGGVGAGGGWSGGLFAAKGGIFPSRAAAGVMLASSGIAGVSAVDHPTYFGSHNVLAGEAGREVMTVMARPQLGSINGEPVMLGSVGVSRLALLSQDSLSAMVNRPRLMASGGMAGALATVGGANNGLKVSSVTNSPSGEIHIKLTPHPAWEAKLVSNSIKGAQVQVATDLSTDTPISRNAKGLIT